MCDRQTTSKYTQRPSPPYPANRCRGKTLAGNDGRLYISVPDKQNVAKWKLAGKSIKKTRRNTRVKTSGKKNSVRRTATMIGKRRKTVKDVARKNSGKKRSASCKKSASTRREDLIKELRCHVKYWEKVTRKNQDMSMERLKEEPLSKIKKHLKWYRSNSPDSSYFF